METPKKFFHDRAILLLLSVLTFLTLLNGALVLLRLDTGRSDNYIVQYRSNLGLSAFMQGDNTTFIGFILFGFLTLIVHTALSFRVYDFHKHYSTTVLILGILLVILSIIVSNALLVLR